MPNLHPTNAIRDSVELEYYEEDVMDRTRRFFGGEKRLNQLKDLLYLS